jgi:hypothetical protein
MAGLFRSQFCSQPTGLNSARSDVTAGKLLQLGLPCDTRGFALGATEAGGPVASDTIRAAPRPALLNRRLEKAALSALLDAVTERTPRNTGSPRRAGNWQTALLDYVIESATDFRLARASGIESELELSYAGIHQLLIPFLPRIDQLPPRQRQALGSAFGLAGGAPPDRFQIGLATLTLLDMAGVDQPILAPSMTRNGSIASQRRCSRS